MNEELDCLDCGRFTVHVFLYYDIDDELGYIEFYDCTECGCTRMVMGRC